MIDDLKDFLNKHWLILAPMAGVNDPVFRELCLKHGAMLTYTEMVSSKALSFKNEKSQNLLKLAINEDKVVVQLFGHEPKTMAQQALWVEKTLGSKLAYIDINMGCPAKKIVKKGDGAALMNTPKLAADIVKACVDACSVPITVKIRRGFAQDDDTCVDFAKSMQEAGASSICIHGRFAMQFYRGVADFDCALKIKNSVDIPVIWSGDVKTYDEAKNIKEGGIDGVMIGRAARGNPFVFSKNKTYDAREKLTCAKFHVINYDKINHAGLSHMRKHCMWYCTGLPGASIARNEFSKCCDVNDYLDVINRLEERIL